MPTGPFSGRFPVFEGWWPGRPRAALKYLLLMRVRALLPRRPAVSASPSTSWRCRTPPAPAASCCAAPRTAARLTSTSAARPVCPAAAPSPTCAPRAASSRRPAAAVAAAATRPRRRAPMPPRQPPTRCCVGPCNQCSKHKCLPCRSAPHIFGSYASYSVPWFPAVSPHPHCGCLTLEFIVGAATQMRNENPLCQPTKVKCRRGYDRPTTWAAPYCRFLPGRSGPALAPQVPVQHVKGGMACGPRQCEPLPCRALVRPQDPAPQYCTVSRRCCSHNPQTCLPYQDASHLAVGSLLSHGGIKRLRHLQCLHLGTDPHPPGKGGAQLATQPASEHTNTFLRGHTSSAGGNAHQSRAFSSH